MRKRKEARSSYPATGNSVVRSFLPEARGRSKPIYLVLREARRIFWSSTATLTPATRKIMKSVQHQSRFSCLWLAFYLLLAAVAPAQTDNPLIGIWAADDGFQVVEFLFRSDGRYQLDTRSTDPVFDFASTERGRYTINGQTLTVTPYDHFGEPSSKAYEFELTGDTLTLNRIDFQITEVYQFKAGSRAEVLARQQVDKILVGTWGRTITFYGKEEYTFRPGGYYFKKSTPESSEFPPEYIRGRYAQDTNQLALTPYSGVEARYELDFFGDTLTIIEEDEFFGQSTAFDQLPGSEAEVRAKAAEAEAFLSRESWQVGTWEIRDDFHTNDLTIRPDGRYIATNAVAFLQGIVRGRYTLEPRRIQFFPFVGQGLYSPDNGEFGKVERTRELDYYDGELQFIDLEAISQSVTLARKRPGSEAAVLEKTQQAQTERARDGWYLGIWEVNDPSGWMEFTFRPDHRYIAKSGTGGAPGQVERGRYLVSSNKVTLAPYAGLSVAARGFELDLYDGDLFLVGDLWRMVVARQVPGSETTVTEKTLNPTAMLGERGSILGRWTANMPGQNVELVFRPDGQFRLQRCANDVVSYDYGLYAVNMATRSLVYDSRFVAVQNLGLDFYGNTMTLYSTSLGPAPSTYTVNLGTVDAAIAASLAADDAETQVDAQWLARIPISPRDPNAVHIPIGNIPADPRPDHIFTSPTVLTNYHLYRRLIPTFVYFNVNGSIRSWAVVNTREWHFFPTGRVLVRFRNHHATATYPITIEDVTDNWGAYRIEPKPNLNDILHIYADNSLFIETDLGEQVEMTLEDGRRNLFWAKDYMLSQMWASEQQPIPCQLPDNPDASLINTGVSLSTSIPPDPLETMRQILFSLAGPVSGNFTISGTTDAAGSVITERTASLASPITWQPWQTNSVPGGAFLFQIPQGAGPAAYFRLRAQ